jgi:hypothetical protein
MANAIPGGAGDPQGGAGGGPGAGGPGGGPGGFAGQGGPGQGGPGQGGPGGAGGQNGANAATPAAVAAATSDLQQTLGNADANADEIKNKVNALHQARVQETQQLVAAEADLRSALTPKQEAILMAAGILE